jgi:hypothetical protein
MPLSAASWRYPWVPGGIYDAVVIRWATARRHWPFAVLFAGGLALRAAAAIAYRPALVYIDTPRYLGGDQGGLDPLGYTYLLLRPVLGAGGGLAGVAIVQHALGLAMAACLYALATRHGAGRWLATLAAAPILLDAYQVQAEQTIMPDVLFEALVVAAMTLLLWPRAPVAARPVSVTDAARMADTADAARMGDVTDAARMAHTADAARMGDVTDAAPVGSTRGARACLARLVCGAALLGLSATVRQVGEFFVVPLLAYVLVVPAWRPGLHKGRLERTPRAAAPDWWPRWRERARRTAAPRRRGRTGPTATAALRPGLPGGWRGRTARAVAALVVFAVPVVGYMALSAGVLGTGFRLSDMNDAYLYARVAHAADCATLRVPGYERPLCPAPATAAKLGVDGLATDPSSAVFSYRPPQGVSRGAATTGFDEAVLTQQSLRVAAAVAGDAVKVFALTRDTAQGDPPISRWQFQRSYPVYRAADRTVLGPTAPRVTAPLAAALRAYQLHGGFTPGPLLLAFLIFGTCGCFARRRHPALAAGCLLATGLAVAAVGGADLYEFSWRYQLPALVTLPLAGALGASAFLRLPVTRWSGGRGTMSRCAMTRRPSQRSGPSPAASSTQTTGSGSAETTSSAATGQGAPTPS